MAKHALVVGGTGMLAEVSLWLVEQGYHVSVIGRSARRLAALQEKASNSARVTLLELDYTNSEKLREEVRATIEQNGAIDLVVAWIHSTAPQALGVISEEVSKAFSDQGSRLQQGQWQLFHLRGSNAYITQEPTPSLPANCDYHRVIFGFVLMGTTSSRWLTNQEISNGVIHAIHENQELSIVGTCEPWERRP